MLACRPQSNMLKNLSKMLLGISQKFPLLQGRLWQNNVGWALRMLQLGVNTVCEAHYKLGGSGGMPPQKNFAI